MATKPVKKKSGFLKKLVIGVFALAVLGAVALTAVIHFADWNAIKDKGAVYLSQTLHHKVSIGSIDASLFTGVTLSKLTIANAAGYGSQPLFYNEEAKLRLSLLSLFTGKLIISEIEFKNPKVFVVKDARGKFNFSDMTTASSAPSSKEASGGDAKSSAPNVIVASFKLSGGDLTYKDLGKGTTQAVKGLDILISGLSLKAGGNSRLEVKFVAETEGKKIPVDLVANFNVDLDAQKIKILSANLKVPSLSAKISGVVTHFKDAPEIDINAEAAAKLETLVADLAPPSALKSLPVGLKTSGQIVLAVVLKGKMAKPESLGFDGSLAFENVGVKYGTYPAIESMNGKLEIGPTKASLPGLEFKMAGSPVKVKLEAKNYSVANLMGPTDKIRLALQYEVTSPNLVLDPIIAWASEDDPPAIAKAKAYAKTLPNAGIVDYRKTVSKDVDISGEIKVDAMQVKAIKTGKFVYTVRVQEQKFQGDMNLDLFDGKFWAKTSADLSIPGPAFSFQSGLSKMQLQKFMDAAVESFPQKKALSELKGKLNGSLSYSAEGKGRGLKAPATSKNLDMKGNFELLDGKLSKLDVQEKLASAIPHPATAEALRKDLEFGQMLGDFTFKNEVMKLNSFEMSSGKDKRQGQMLILASGQLRVGGAADFKVVPHFNPNVVKLDGVLQDAFADEAGWATYNSIGYAGPTLDSAKANFKEGAKNAAKQVVQKEATKLIQDKGKDLIKQLPGGLQNLFGK